MGERRRDAELLSFQRRGVVLFYEETQDAQHLKIFFSWGVFRAFRAFELLFKKLIIIFFKFYIF